LNLGIMSDTHDNITNIKKAISIFNANIVDLVIHAGDYVAPFALAPLDDLKCDFAGVFGNNDGEKAGLTKRSLGKIKSQPLKFDFQNMQILVIHEPNNLDDLIKSQIYDIIIYGHTHSQLAENHGKTLVINPGECCGWVTGKATVAILDVDNMAVKFIEI